MPPMVNLQESGLRRSPRLQQKKGILVSILTTYFSSTLLPDMIYGTTNGVTLTIEQMNTTLNEIDLNFDGTFNSFMTHAFALHFLRNAQTRGSTRFCKCHGKGNR
jgi:alpha-ketoglutarate-dependent taurine dioxygenase